MRITVLTLFPEMFNILNASVVGRAVRSGVISFDALDIRSFTSDKHHKADDYAFGGGPGLVMYAKPIMDAIAHVLCGLSDTDKTLRVYLSPRGRALDQRMVERLAGYDNLVLLCGHYEGVDQRAIDACIDEDISIGDYILTGGEPAAIVLIDAVARLVPGVLGKMESAANESFSADNLLEYPQYTHPRIVDGVAVPDVLISGDHARIEAWKRRQSLRVTWERRPDLLAKANLTSEERTLIAQWSGNQKDNVL